GQAEIQQPAGHGQDEHDEDGDDAERQRDIALLQYLLQASEQVARLAHRRRLLAAVAHITACCVSFVPSASSFPRKLESIGWLSLGPGLRESDEWWVAIRQPRCACMPSPGTGMETPSSPYCFSLFLSVRMEMPRMLAAWVRLPRQLRSVLMMSSCSTSAT